eukprot:709664-Rhodomonas_salina.1
MMTTIYSDAQSGIAQPAAKTAGGMRVVRKRNAHAHRLMPAAEDGGTTLPNEVLGDTAPALDLGNETVHMAPSKDFNKRMPDFRKAQLPTVQKHTSGYTAPNLSTRRSGRVMQPRPGF